jgi:hypothetical protein
LDFVGNQAFGRCEALNSIILPSSVKTLGWGCFTDCGSLSNSPLPADSEVLRIEGWAFSGCSALKSMVLPSSTEFVGECCFVGCHSLSRLTFASPCHLRELLDLPLVLTGVVSIPNSVESVMFHESAPPRLERTLTFGRDSKLAKLRSLPIRGLFPSRSFLQVSSRILKLFRADFEFDGGV